MTTASGVNDQDPYALIMSRDGIWDPFDKPVAPTLPDIDDAGQLDRWEPWVRAGVYQAELLSSLQFVKEGKGYAVCHLSHPDAKTFELLPIACLTRPSEATFAAQTERTISWAELRMERQAEIMAQITPQYAFWGQIVHLHPQTTRNTIELINMAFDLAINVELRFKHALACWRPVDYSAQVQPMIATPGHGSFPCGHATQAYVVAHVLQKLLGIDSKHAISKQLERQAARISTNRVVAGVHFPVDNIAARLLGTTLAEYLVSRCVGLKDGYSTKPTWRPRKFDAVKLDEETPSAEFMPDFQPFREADSVEMPAPAYYQDFFAAVGKTMRLSAEVSPILNQLWVKAKNEWRRQFRECEVYGAMGTEGP